MIEPQHVTETGTHYTREGEGPALVFIHGAGGNAAVWFQQVQVFAHDYTVLCVDLPGFGLSLPREGGLVPDSLGEIVLEVMDHAQVERASIIGQSLGGWFALRAALSAPERVNRLILSCSMAGVAHTPAVQAFVAALASMGAAGLAEFTLSSNFARVKAAKAYLFRQITAFNPPADHAAIGPLFAPDALMPEDELKRIGCPVLMISGSEDPIWPPNSLEGIAAIFPQAKQEILNGTGHSPYFEKAEDYNLVVRRFLRRMV